MDGSVSPATSDVMHGMTAKTRNHGMTDAASRLEGALEDAWCMQSDARSSSSCRRKSATPGMSASACR